MLINLLETYRWDLLTLSIRVINTVINILLINTVINILL